MLAKIGYETPIAIIGMGVSGIASYKLLLLAGLKKDQILLFDEQKPEVDFSNPQTLLSKGKPKTLLVSPGYPLSSGWIVEARKNHIHITSEIELALQFLTTEKIVGITGSIGKSTTVAALGYGFTSSSEDCFTGGNLGQPLADYVIAVLSNQRPRATWIILELSSYQLENVESLNCAFSAITYLTPNHLERYSSKKEYYDTKWSLVRKTHGRCVMNKNGGDLYEYAKGFDQDKLNWVSGTDQGKSKYQFKNSKLIGEHNEDNLAIAVNLAIQMGASIKQIEKIMSFPGLPHRLENCGKTGGVLYINDSKATTVQSVIDAVKASYSKLENGHSLFLLVGGRDKNLPWKDLAELSQFSDLKFFFFGEVAEKALAASGISGPCFKKLSEALPSVKKQLKSGDILLLSPGGTSHDEFHSFEERGDFFKNEIAKR